MCMQYNNYRQVKIPSMHSLFISYKNIFVYEINKLCTDRVFTYLKLLRTIEQNVSLMK
jgi:hypothetical protein